MTKYLVLAAVLAACGGTARTADVYRTDTQHLLESRNPTLKACYDEALKTNSAAAGTVTVKFDVAKKTGLVTNASLDTSKTTAPTALGECVLKSVDGLKLDPPDRNEGQATFAFEFKQGT